MVEKKTMARKFIAACLSLVLFTGNFAVCEEPKDIYNTSTPGATSAASAGPSARAPLIEVSVDALEITETNSNVLGILWGQQGPVTNGIPAFDPNRLNFLETSPMPVIFDANKFNRGLLFGQLQAQIQNNQLRILANPTLMTKSGFEATFLVGGEIPYPTPAPVGQAPGVDFKKYGVALKILPQITPRSTIEAQINVGVSNPDPSVAISIGGTTVPGLSAREAISKVEVNDGETVVLAGIKQSRRSKVVTKVPILGSIPLLGLLFRHKDEEVTQTSLVFFVTFRLVKS
jgi:type II secretory pathway component GspD/PulD (secretin)